MRFAPHLGFPAPDRPLFADLLDTADPVRHMRFAAEQGFDAISDPFTMARDAEQQRRIGDEAAALGLEVGAFLYAPLDVVRSTAWGGEAGGLDERIAALIEEAIEAGRRIGSSQIAILSAALAQPSDARQQQQMAERLKRAADRCAAVGFTLCLEAVDPARLPGLLLTSLEQAHKLVRSVAHPGVGLIFDTGHAAATEADLADAYRRVRADVAVVQFADRPGRVEMGAGTIDFQSLLVALREQHFAGAVELEHGWSRNGPAVQRDYLLHIATIASPTALEGTIAP